MFFCLMIRRPPRSTLSSSSAASEVYRRQVGHTPTQAVEVLWDVQASGHECVIYMGDANSIGALLDYSEDLIYDAHAYETPVELATFRAPEEAHLDAVSLFLMHISCVNESSYTADGTISQVACAITPDMAPGSLL